MTRCTKDSGPEDPGRERREERRRRYGVVLDLWERENPIKTQKLQFLLLTNALLLAAFLFLSWSTTAGRAAFLALFMVAADLVWLLSLGRTVAYQRLRKRDLEMIRSEDPSDLFLAIHAPSGGPQAFWGRVSSSTYLVGTPAALSVLWGALALWALL